MRVGIMYWEMSLMNEWFRSVPDPERPHTDASSALPSQNFQAQGHTQEGKGQMLTFQGTLEGSWVLSAVLLRASPSGNSKGCCSGIITSWAPVSQTNSRTASIHIISTLKGIRKWVSEKLGNLPDVMAGRIIAGIGLKHLYALSIMPCVPPKGVHLDQWAGNTAERGHRENLSEKDIF